MGKNKLKKFTEMATFENVIQASYYESKQPDHRLKGNWNGLFFSKHQPIVLELGCGKGEYTVALAELLPAFNYIGVDIKGARMWKGAKQALADELKNVGFLRTGIHFIEQFFAPSEVEEIWLTFSDPQMKNARKRLTSSYFMEQYRRILKKDGIVHVKTDSRFQYEYTLAMVRINEFELIACSTNIDGEMPDDKILAVQTFYEKQWRERGLPIRYLAFRISHDRPLVEPDVQIERDDYRSFGRSARE